MYGTDHGENDEKQPGDSHERELRDQEAHKGRLPASQAGRKAIRMWRGGYRYTRSYEDGGFPARVPDTLPAGPTAGGCF